MEIKNTLTVTLTSTIAVLAMIGCDERVVAVSREASDRQAVQNLQMAELQQEVASGTRELVKSDAAARKEFAGVHRDLQRERRMLSNSWNGLELERRRVDLQRRNYSVGSAVAAALLGVLILAAILGFLWQLLALASHGDSLDEELSELVLKQLTMDAQGPMSLPSGDESQPTAISPKPLET